MERTDSTGFGGNGDVRVGGIGHGIFGGLLLLETLLVVFLAPRRRPARSASSARSRRSTCSRPRRSRRLAIVFGKLFSALVYVCLLILASIPLTASSSCSAASRRRTWCAATSSCS